MSGREARDVRPDHPGPIDGWPEADYDAVLHLLDRQIVDVDGRLVGKVDDIELVEGPDGSLVPTALLIGMAALLPRIGGWIYRRWVRLSPVHEERNRPGVIELDLVDDVTSAVHLTVPRDGLVRPRADDTPGQPARRTLGQLLAMDVELPREAGGTGHGTVRVLDARLRSRPDAHGVRIESLIVGHGRPGSLLGYERSPDRGPRLVAAVIAWLHRHSRVVEVGEDVEIQWDAGVVRVGPGAAVGPCCD